MTEAEWLSHGDFARFVHALYKKGTERQIRLFACACCRRVWRFMTDERSRRAVEVAERLADRTASRVERKRAENEARAARQEAGAANNHALANAAACALYTIGLARDAKAMVLNVADDTTNAARYAVELGEGGRREDEAAAQALLAADIMGNPFRIATFDPAWQTSAVAALARAIYEERAFDRMPILADALEDAGCHNEDIIEHCRGTLPHCRGCWVVDLILGKE